VEAVADMTPEQLEEVPGIGPKTVEKSVLRSIIIFPAWMRQKPQPPGNLRLPAPRQSPAKKWRWRMQRRRKLARIAGRIRSCRRGAEEASLAEEEASLVAAEAEGAGDQSPVGPDSAGQSGDVEACRRAEADSESVEELVEEGQYYEAEVVDGVENAPLADEAELTIHERPAAENENVSEEEKPAKNVSVRRSAAVAAGRQKPKP